MTDEQERWQLIVARERERLLHEGYEAAVKECHALLDLHGIPSAARVPCNDPECQTQLGHRLRELLKRTMIIKPFDWP